MKFEIIYCYAGEKELHSILCNGPYMLAGSLSVLVDDEHLNKINIVDILKY